MEDRIIIFDTTLRDGEQSPGCSMTVEEKLRMAKQLERLRVDVIEAGFPIASTGDFEAVRRIAGMVETSSVAGLSRTVLSDIDRTWEAIREARKPRIHTFIATSDIHMTHKLKKTRAQVLSDAQRAVAHARSLCPDVEFSCEDASRSDMEFLCEIAEAVIESGATVLNLPDTVGYSVPAEYGAMFRTLRERVPRTSGIILSAHCHNDLGLAVANSLAAVENGVRQIECTVNGIGERAGNAALEEIVLALKVRSERLRVKSSVNTEEIYRSSRLLTNLTGMVVQRNKAIVGANAFAHEAGIHQDGMLKSALTYEIMTPQSVGITHSTLVLGKHSGRHAIKKRCEELGYNLSAEELERVYGEFCTIADQKKEVFDEELLAIVEAVEPGAQEQYRLEALHVSTGTNVRPTATVELKSGEDRLVDSATGDGPVDAAMEVLRKCVSDVADIRLEEYHVDAIRGGTDALVDVRVRLSKDGKILTSRGARADIIMASVEAMIAGMNRLLREEHENRGKNPR